MLQVKIGTKVNPIGISRVNLADGSKCRAILVDPNPRVKYLAWDDRIKRRVEVNQEAVIKYNLRPYTNFYYLVAKLNTDMNSNIVSDDFVIEYLALSENVNNEFSDAINESGAFTSLLLSKVTKKSKNTDFSYVKPIPSNIELPASLTQKLAQIDKQSIETMWAFVDRDTSMTFADYEEMIKTLPESESKVVQQSQIQQIKQSVQISSPDNFAETLSPGDEFATGF